MNTKRNCKRWLAVFAMLSALMLGSIVASAAEDTDTITVNVTATYGQTDARSILKMINDFRAESGVWYWSEDGDHKEKTVYNTAGSIELSPLQYDYELEEIAMKRAMQIALQYEHTRPDAPINPDPENLPTNPADCVFPLIPGYRTAGENIAAGYPTAEDVFVGWQEEDKDYWGQGHRRNMLNPEFTSVGIGYVHYNNTDYWIQVFRAPTGTAAETDPLDGEVTRSVEILKENITKQEVTASENSLEIPYGDSVPLPGINCKLLLNETWPKNSLRPVTLDSASTEWSVESGADCVTIDSSGQKIIGKKCGTAEISTTVWNTPVTVSVEVTPKPIDDAEIILDSDADLSYTGSEITPDVSEVRLSDILLKEDDDYIVSYSNNTDVGTATVTITGIGNYDGTATTTFDIIPAELADANSKISDIEEQPYTGSEIEPAVTVTYNGGQLSGSDYKVSYENNINVGKASVTVSGTGNYTGSISTVFYITPADLSKCKYDDIPDQDYSGKQITPNVTLMWNDHLLEQGKDYTVSYGENTNVGESGSVDISGVGNFTGEITANFNIVPADLSGAEVQSIEDQTYTGEEIIPEVSVSLNGASLSAKTDYTVSYSNNTNAGTATVTVTGQGNYKGEALASFQIQPLELTEEDCMLGEIPAQTYTGEVITPSVTVSFGEKTLTQGVDYTVYSGSTNVGEATATVTAMGNYSGKLGNVSFPILPADLADCTTDQIADQTYTGSALTPPVTVYLGELGLVLDQDYTVSYEDNILVGTAVVTLTGINNFTGTCTLSFTITAPAPSVPSVSLPQPGTVATDSASGAKCRVSGSGASGATVEYMAPVNKKKTTVTIPDVVVINHVSCKVTSISPNAFKNNKKLKKVVVGKNVTSIGKNAFRGCTKLTTVKLNAQVTKINSAAFYGCTALKSVTIPAAVKSIGKQAFYKCSRLKKITIKSKQLTSKSIGSKAFSKINRKAVVKVPAKQKKAYRKLLKKKGLPSSVKIK